MILSSIGDAVIATNASGKVTYLNPLAETLTGWFRVDAIGKQLDAIFNVVNDETRNKVENSATKILRGDSTIERCGDTLLIAKDGTERLIDDHAAPIRDNEGKLTGAVLVCCDRTVSKKQAKMVQDTLDFIDTILVTLREPVLILDNALRIVKANRAFHDVFQLDCKETQGQVIFDLGNRQWDVPKLRSLLDDVLKRSNIIQHFELEHVFLKAGQKILLINACRVQHPVSHSDLILLAFDDVTERYKINSVSSILAAIVNSSEDAIISTSLDGVITSWNQGAEHLFGYRSTEALGRNVFLFIPKERHEEERAVFAKMRQGEKVKHFETERITRDGQRIKISMTVSPVKDSTERTIGVSRISHDITERREAQRQLQASETRFRRLFEAANDGILILDGETRKITHVNPFLVKMLDYPESHFLGKELWEIGFLSDKQASQHAMQLLHEKGTLRYESLPLEDRQGRTHPVEMVANLYQEDQQLVVQCNIRDISERSRLETLQRIQAVELSDLHRRKDEFLAMLSHELRSPLAPIANAVQLLGLHYMGEDSIQRHAIEIIERQLSQLQHLVDDLLEVSRITTGRVQLRCEWININEIVNSAAESIRPLVEHRRHELTITLPPKPIWLEADRARLEQVLVNLLTNAAKYTDIGGKISLSVKLEENVLVSKSSAAEQPNRAVAIRVRDTGVGISPELKPKVFDLFTQSDRSLDRAQGGLGIGLALVQRITELHAGTVEVSSALGKGSEFIVRLPISGEFERKSQKVASPANLSFPSSGLKILVVDDSKDTVLSLSHLLRASGHEVRSAHDGPSAIQMVLDLRPNVVFLDIGLPGLNGYEVATRIRQHDELKNVVLVALTGYGQESDRKTSLKAGFNHHLVKPARLEQLQKILAIASVQTS